jgi:hypothetical protein
MANETLRARVERIYRFEVMQNPLALDLAQPEIAATYPTLTIEETASLALYMAGALRTALFDLAEQLDALLDGQVKPE